MDTPAHVTRELWASGVDGVAPVPVLTARGASDGPTLVVTGGVHGDEYEGPAAIYELFNRLERARDLQGAVVGLPVVNGAAWQARTRVAPDDGTDMNRVFDRRAPFATRTEALAAQVFETFVRPADALVDLHSGGVALQHLPLIGWYGDTIGSEAEEAARQLYQTLHPWRIPDVPGVLSYEAHRAGKVALGAEWGGGGRLDPQGAAGFVIAAIRMMSLLGITDEPLTSPRDNRPAIAGDYQSVEQSGLFSATVSLGDTVKAGATLGTLTNELGRTTATVTAVRGGIVAGLAHVPLLRAGSRVAYIG